MPKVNLWKLLEWHCTG